MIIPIDTPWKLGDYAVRERTVAPSIICGHWTSGTGGKTFADDLDTVWKRMRARKNPDGKPLKVSVHYLIGRDGRIAQYADPATTVCYGCGNSAVNSRAIHIEVVSPGVGRPSEKYPSHVVERVVRGRKVKCLAFLPAQIESWRELVWHLCAVHDIPRMAVVRTTALSPQEAKTFSGVMEHLHVPGTTKIDAAGMLCDAAFAGGESEGERAGFIGGAL